MTRERADESGPNAGDLAAALRRRALSWRAVAWCGVLGGLYLFVALLTLRSEPGVFSSPDETANFVIARSFGETGDLYYERDYFVEDHEGLLHPRALLRYQDRVVLPNYHGLPVLYGAGYALFGDQVTLVALLLAPLCLYFLYETAALILKQRSLLLAVAVVGVGPLLYWFSRPYWNSLGATTFFAGGLFFLTRWYYGSRWSGLVWSAALFSASMLFRYEYAVFIAPLVAIVLFQKHGVAGWRGVALGLAVLGAVAAVVFVLPLILLNLHVYGRPLVFPTQLLERSVVSDAAGPGSFVEALRTARDAVQPKGFEPLLVGRNLLRFTFALAPALTLLSLGGLALALWRRVFAIWQLVAFGALLVYYLFFVGSVDTTYLAKGWDVSFEASVVRYWLLLYVVMYFGAAYFVVNVPGLLRGAWPRVSTRLVELVPFALVGVLVASTVPMVWYSWAGSLETVRAARENGEVWHDRVASVTEPDAVVYSTPTLHRYIAAARDTAVLNIAPNAPPGAQPDPSNPEAQVAAFYAADHMARVAQYRPVYIIDRGVDLESLDVYLQGHGYRLEQVNNGPIYRVAAF